jgi:hypothetical protein
MLIGNAECLLGISRIFSKVMSGIRILSLELRIIEITNRQDFDNGNQGPEPWSQKFNIADVKYKLPQP